MDLIDFDQWMESMGVDITKQPKATETTVMIFERLYDLIIDTRKQIE